MTSGVTKAEAPTFDEIVDAYEVPLVRYAYRITRDVPTARDVVQDVFLRLLRHGIPKSPEHLAAWLYRVCRNRAVDVGRRHANDAFLEEDAWASLRDEAGPRAADGFDPRIPPAVSALPPTQQEVLWLRFAEELSYAEIGAVLGKSSAHVGVVLHRAISALRAALGDEEPGADPEGEAPR